MVPKSQKSSPVNLNTFLSTHAVFSVKDVQQFLAEHGSTNPKTRKALLSYHRSRGRILPIRRGLYASIPSGYALVSYAVDPVLIAAKMADDSVIAYHTALEYHGKAYSRYNRMVFFSDSRTPTTEFRGTEYMRIAHPSGLRAAGKTKYGVESHHRDGVVVRVTNHERTLVDVLDRPDVSGSWEEIWRSLEMIEFFDLDQVVQYVELLENATTAAKVGFYLNQHRDELMADDKTFAELKTMIPKQPHYMDRGARKGCRLISEWNLLVPRQVLDRSWEEVL